MKEYFIVRNDNQEGPFSIEELKEKDISPDTLVWWKGKENWDKAKNIPELKNKFKDVPPPIPNKSTKKKEGFSKQATANELKINAKLLGYGLLLIIFIYPILYFPVLEVNKYDNVDVYEDIDWEYNRRERNKVINNPSIGTFGKDLGPIELKDFRSLPLDSFNSPEETKSRIERRKNRLSEVAIKASIFYSFLAGFILIIGRYIIKGINWINSNAND